MSELTEAKVRQIVREEIHEQFNAPAGTIVGIKNSIGGLESDVTHLKSDVTVLKSDVTELKSDVADLKSDVSDLKSDVSDLKIDVRRLGVMFEHFDAKMDAMAELVATTVSTRTGVIDHDTRIRRLEDDMLVVKATLKK